MKLPPFVKTIFVTIIDELFPVSDFGRNRLKNTEYILCKILKVLRTGMQWNELDTSFIHYKTIHNYFI